ncbi:hypothetical protein AYO41_04580, partial [Verrucomicrobia bacterium SCGC AG-212-E04]
MTLSPAKPLGDEHLELRAELGTVLFALMMTARDAGLLTPALQQMHTLATDLRSPFTFMVAGEVKAGKSTLLNALFGREVCRADALPATDRVHRFMFGIQPNDQETGRALVEHYRPENFLRDFQLVDTPGVNSTDPRHQELAAGFVPLADVVFFVFPVTNPWSATAWEFLEHIQRRWLRRVIVIVQQIDLRETQEVDSIVAHVRKMCDERLREDVPIFPVSAKHALRVKRGEAPDNGLWEQSGFGPLERTINQLLESDPLRFERMLRSVRLGQMELKPIAERVGFALSLLESDRHELARATRQMYENLAEQRHAIESLQQDFDRALTRCWRRGVEMLGERLHPMRAMKLTWTSDSTWKESFRASLAPAVHAALARQVEVALAKVDTEMRAARMQFAGLIDTWVQLGPHPKPGAASDDLLRRRADKQSDLEDQLAEALDGDAPEREFRAAFAEAAGARFLRDGSADQSLAAALTDRLTDLTVKSAAEVLDEMPGGIGLTAVGRRKQILDAYQVAMTDQGETIARSIRTLFARFIETCHDRLMRALAPYEDFGHAEEARWRQIAATVDDLSQSLQRVRARLEGR